MGSKLTRQRSLDVDAELPRRRRRRNEAESEKSARSRSGKEFLFASLLLRSDRLPGVMRRGESSPSVRRVEWIREIQRLLRDQRLERAAEVLKVLRKVRVVPSLSFSLILVFSSCWTWLLWSRYCLLN